MLNLLVEPGVAAASSGKPRVRVRADYDEVLALFERACPGAHHEALRRSGATNYAGMMTHVGIRSLRDAPDLLDGLAVFINKRRMAPQPVDATELRKYVDEYHENLCKSEIGISGISGSVSVPADDEPSPAIDTLLPNTVSPSSSKRIADAIETRERAARDAEDDAARSVGPLDGAAPPEGDESPSARARKRAWHASRSVVPCSMQWLLAAVVVMFTATLSVTHDVLPMLSVSAPNVSP